jgi:hypothetical protein
MRKHRHLILVLVLGFVVVLIFLYVATSTPPASLAVSFVGVTNDVAGAPMSIFSITNRGTATVVIWGYYKIDAKQDFAVRHPTIFGDSYTFLAPGESQTAAIYVPETRGAWKVSIGYGSYDRQCRWSLFAADLPARIRDAIPERFRDVPKDLVASDWIESR